MSIYTGDPLPAPPPGYSAAYPPPQMAQVTITRSSSREGGMGCTITVPAGADQQQVVAAYEIALATYRAFERDVLEQQWKLKEGEHGKTG